MPSGRRNESNCAARTRRGNVDRGTLGGGKLRREDSEMKHEPSDSERRRGRYVLVFVTILVALLAICVGTVIVYGALRMGVRPYVLVIVAALLCVLSVARVVRRRRQRD